MIKIAVVDDDIQICSHIERYMLDFAVTHCQKIEVELYTTSEAFLCN